MINMLERDTFQLKGLLMSMLRILEWDAAPQLDVIYCDITRFVGFEALPDYEFRPINLSLYVEVFVLL